MFPELEYTSEFSFEERITETRVDLLQVWFVSRRRDGYQKTKHKYWYLTLYENNQTTDTRDVVSNFVYIFRCASTSLFYFSCHTPIFFIRQKIDLFGKYFLCGIFVNAYMSLCLCFGFEQILLMHLVKKFIF